jgi:hypothetical protein
LIGFRHKLSSRTAGRCFRGNHPVRPIGKHPISSAAHCDSFLVMTMPVPCYLVEWYRPSVTTESLGVTAARLNACAASVSALGPPVRLLTMLAVPSDEVLFGIFTADSASAVTQTCDRAGLPAHRITTATDLDLSQCR